MDPAALSPPELRQAIEAQVAAKDFSAAARSMAALLGRVKGTPRLWLRLARYRGQAGDLAGSVDALERGLDAFPGDRLLATEHVRRAAELLRRRRAPYQERDPVRAELRTFDLDAPDTAELLSLVGTASLLPDVDFARTALERALPRVGTVVLAKRAMSFVPIFHERVEAGLRYALLLDRVDALEGTPVERDELRLALLFALRRQDAFLAAFDAAEEPLAPAYPIIARRWRTNMAELMREPRVIGIGLPKTATTSLAAALSRLGFFHADHHCPITNQFLTIEDAMFFDSISDSMAAHAFELLYQMFPNARFIVTERDVASWSASYANHNQTYNGVGTFDRSEHGFAASAMVTRHGINQKLMHFATVLNHPDHEAAHAAHRARVDSFFRDKPADKLLRFNVVAGDGWEKLCRFLGVPVPPIDFPHSNRAQPSS